MAASPDGTTLSIVSDDPAPVGTLCDFARSKQATTLDARIAIPSPGGKRFLAVQEGRLAVHSILDGRFPGMEAFIYGEATEFAINRDGDRVAAYTGGTEVLLWDPENNAQFIQIAVFDPTGKFLYVRIGIWIICRPIRLRPRTKKVDRIATDNPRSE